MKLNTETLKTLFDASEVVPGNIYPAKGGRKPGTEYWLVIAVSETGAHLIGFNSNQGVLPHLHTLAAQGLIRQTGTRKGSKWEIMK